MSEAKPRITLVAQEFMRLATTLIAEHAALQKRLTGLKGFPEAAADIQAQVRELMPKDFLVAYPWERLAHFPRYLKAAGVRLDHYQTDYRSTIACTGTGANACGDRPPGTIIPSVDADTSDTLFNWKVGALYKPTAYGSFYANYAVSQQPPGGSTLELSASASNATVG